MKFYEIPLDAIFKIPNSEDKYQKLTEERVSCCKVKRNAKKLVDESDVVFRPMQDVEVVTE